MLPQSTHSTHSTQPVLQVTIFQMTMLLTLFVLTVLIVQPTTSAMTLSADRQGDTPYDCAAATGIDVGDCNVLVTLYSETDGSNWRTNSGWLQTNSPCGWHGVSCLGSRVTELDLNTNQLRGSIPEELGQLSNLTKLVLLINELSGSIPTELGQLSNLTELVLFDNKLSGSIPAELGQLSNLTFLLLNGNQLNGSIPPELGQLSNLTRLWLYHNDLSGAIPAELGQLSNLTFLWLVGNDLSGAIPAELGQLSNLTSLDLNLNKLSGSIPPELGQLSNLTFLDLHSNKLGGSIPAELGQLSNLTRLHLYSNQLNGQIPSPLVCPSVWPNITEFNIDFNRLGAEDQQSADCLNDRSSTWESTQTIPPANVQVSVLSLMSARLTWEPILYTADGGYYEIGLSTNGGASYNVVATTSDKTIDNITIAELTPGIQYTFAVRTFTPAHNGQNDSNAFDDQQNDLTSDFGEGVTVSLSTPTPPFNTPTNTPTSTPTNPPTATPTNTPTATSSPTPQGDIHEPNNTCATANAIPSDGSLQTHTVHRQGDVDWVKFEAQANRGYRIDARIPIGSKADVTLEMYSSCDSLPEDEWNERFTPGVRLDFTAPSSGSFYLKLANVDAAVAGDDVGYELSVTELSEEPQGGAVIILAGRYKANDRLQGNIYNIAENVFRLFEANGYDANDIYYLAPEPRTGRDASATMDNLRLAITEWAPQTVGANQALTLYLVDHGDRDLLFIDELNNERLAPDQLDEWLTSFEEAVPTANVNVVVEACHSGSFIEGAKSVSKTGRVVITSTNVDWDAYVTDAGAFFSDQLIVSLELGRNLFTSYLDAKRYVGNSKEFQEPWIDANGNRNPGEDDDFTIAAQRGFAYAGTLPGDRWSPHIFSVEGPETLTNRSGILTADIRDNMGIDRAWAVIYPPSYEPPTPGPELVAETLEKLLLDPTGEGDTFTARYSGFNEIGTYRIVIHAQDEDGLAALPYVIEVEVGNRLYLPLIQ
ncbi:MAG: C13 family peptidase [Chloroflexota bacterium]